MRGTRIRVAGAVLVAVAMTVLTACIGAVDRSDFEQELRERGSGVVPSLPLGGVRALEDRLGSRELRFTGISITPGTQSVTFAVRNPGSADELDTWRWQDGSLSGPEPVQLGAGTDLDGQSFSASSVPALGSIDTIVDEAIRALELRDGWVTGVTVDRRDTGVQVEVTAESRRARGRATFAADGRLLQAERT